MPPLQASRWSLDRSVILAVSVDGFGWHCQHKSNATPTRSLVIYALNARADTSMSDEALMTFFGRGVTNGEVMDLSRAE